MWKRLLLLLNALTGFKAEVTCLHSCGYFVQNLESSFVRGALHVGQLLARLAQSKNNDNLMADLSFVKWLILQLASNGCELHPWQTSRLLAVRADNKLGTEQPLTCLCWTFGALLHGRVWQELYGKDDMRAFFWPDDMGGCSGSALPVF